MGVVKRKVYIAGKITGFDGYREKFESANKHLSSKGYLVMNPAVLPEGFEWGDYMEICMAMIDACDCIYFLDNWKDSKGAMLEYDYGMFAGKEIMFQ